jgi:O-methyltransferase
MSDLRDMEIRVDNHKPDGARQPGQVFNHDTTVEILKSGCIGLQQAVYYVLGAAVDGDIAEFGTGSGFTALGIAVAMMLGTRNPGAPEKSLHLFDSFEGFPEPTGHDKESPHAKRGHWFKGGEKHQEPHQLRAQVASVMPNNRIIIYPGWYENTVRHHLHPKMLFAMIHIDCDFEQSTMDALAPLFERHQIAEGAVICFDNWMCNQGNPDFGEQAAWRQMRDHFNIRASFWGFYGWSAARWIVHSYD